MDNFDAIDVEYNSMNGLRKDRIINPLQSQILPGTKNWTLTELVFSDVL